MISFASEEHRPQPLQMKHAPIAQSPNPLASTSLRSQVDNIPPHGTTVELLGSTSHERLAQPPVFLRSVAIA